MTTPGVKQRSMLVGEMNIDAVTKAVEIKGERFPVVDTGSGPPVLLLHGFPDSRFLWRHQIPALTAAGFRVIAPDLRGYGDAAQADGLAPLSAPIHRGRHSWPPGRACRERAASRRA